jgi:ketosteroid isomerase-like protein
MFSVAHADEYSDVSQLMRTGKLAEAGTKADQFLATKPKDPQMRFLKGVIQRDAGKSAEAISIFTRLTEDYPELPEPYNNLAVLYAGQSQFDKARTALEMAIRTNPSYATAHENLGDVYAKLASQAYNKALQLDASNSAVPPKLALIRELFSTSGAKGQQPAPALPTGVLANTSAKLPPTLPTPVFSKATPAVAPVPVVTAPKPTSPPVPSTIASAATDNPSKEAEAAVRSWAAAWAAKDVKAYLAAYSSDFDPAGSTKRRAWEEERRERIENKSKISVKLDNLKVSVNGNKAIAKFRQAYRADKLAVSSNKTLELAKSGDRWLIVRESNGS